MAEHSGELAVVTGASSGIGFELAGVLAEEGYDLFITADGATGAAPIFRLETG